MSDEKAGSGGKGFSGGSGHEADDDPKRQAASRARNRTVMLTPEMTGQVRAMLHETKREEEPASGDPLSELLPPIDWGRGSGQRGDASHEQRPSAPGAIAHTSVVQPPVARYEESKPTGEYSRQALSESPEGSPARRQMFSVNPNVGTNVKQSVGASRGAGSGAASIGVVRHKSRVVGFLISFDKDENGQVYEILAGRWLLTSRPTDHGDFILIEDESISPLHAIVRATPNGKIQVLDQLSEHGTGLLKKEAEEEVEVAGSMVVIEHGDIVRFGQRQFVVCVVPQLREKDEGLAD